MQNIWDLFLFILFVADKPRNGDISPKDVEKALYAAQNILFDMYWEDGKGLTRKSANALQPFVVSQPLTSNGDGLLVLPADFVHEKMLYRGKLGLSGFQRINPVTEDGVPDAVASALAPIAEYPRYMEAAGGLQLFPAQATNLTLQYYRKPVAPVINYTVVSGNPAYAPVGSTQLEFKKDYWLEIVYQALPLIGVTLSNPDLYSLASTYPKP